MIIDEKEKLSQKPHNVIIEDRSRISVTGVSELDSFDEQRIILKTNRGVLILKGKDLHVDKLSLDTGDLSVTGHLTDLGYEEPASGGGFFSRLFK